MSNPFRSLAVFNYRLWFAGVTVSNIGTWMQRTAQDWIVLTELTDHDAAAVGLTTAFQFGPVLLLTPLVGLVADMVDRRKLLLATQIVMGAIGVAFAVLCLTAAIELWMVYALALLLGVASAFDGPARQSFVSELVSPSLLSNAVGLNATSFTVARLVGPAVAGLLIVVTGAGWVLLINGATFLATIGGLLAMRTSELHTHPRALLTRGHFRAGIIYVRERPDLALVVVNALIFGAMGMSLPIFVAAMSTIEFRLGAAAFGALASVIAVGSVAGALMGARRERARLSTIAVAGLAFGLGTLGCALSPNAWVFAAFLVSLGVTSVLIMNTGNAYLQTATPPQLRGRVMAIYVAVNIGGPTVGAPLIGFIATTAGPRWAVVIAAFGGLIPAIVSLIWWIHASRLRLRWERRAPFKLRADTVPLVLSAPWAPPHDEPAAALDRVSAAATSAAARTLD